MWTGVTPDLVLLISSTWRLKTQQSPVESTILPRTHSSLLPMPLRGTQPSFRWAECCPDQTRGDREGNSHAGHSPQRHTGTMLEEVHPLTCWVTEAARSPMRGGQGRSHSYPPFVTHQCRAHDEG